MTEFENYFTVNFLTLYLPFTVALIQILKYLFVVEQELYERIKDDDELIGSRMYRHMRRRMKIRDFYKEFFTLQPHDDED